MELFVDKKLGLAVVRDGENTQLFVPDWKSGKEHRSPAEMLGAAASVWEALLDPEVTGVKKTSAFSNALKSVQAPAARFDVEPSSSAIAGSIVVGAMGHQVVFLYASWLKIPLQKVQQVFSIRT